MKVLGIEVRHLWLRSLVSEEAVGEMTLNIGLTHSGNSYP